jgi:signal peptidase I
MYPCLNDGDIILSIKRKSVPNYGSIIVFKNANSDETYIKRIIGVPNDTIVIQDDGIYIYSCNKDIVDFFQYDNYRFFNKSNSTCCLKIPTIDSLNISPSVYKKIIVKPNTFFVLGDNVNNSCDSRYFGLINSKQIIDIFLTNLF